MSTETTAVSRILQGAPTVEEGYRHARKRVVPGEPQELRGALLKWYEVHPLDRPVPEEIARLARGHLTATPLEARGLGFVLLHRCGKDFYSLIVCTWRNSNELWETVFYKDGEAMERFEPFPRDGAHKPALCVWEMVPAWHEQQAWVRFLESPRGENAAQLWLRDRFAGAA